MFNSDQKKVFFFFFFSMLHNKSYKFGYNLR